MEYDKEDRRLYRRWQKLMRLVDLDLGPPESLPDNPQVDDQHLIVHEMFSGVRSLRSALSLEAAQQVEILETLYERAG